MLYSYFSLSVFVCVCVVCGVWCVCVCVFVYVCVCVNYEEKWILRHCGSVSESVTVELSIGSKPFQFATKPRDHFITMKTASKSVHPFGWNFVH